MLSASALFSLFSSSVPPFLASFSKAALLLETLLLDALVAKPDQAAGSVLGRSAVAGVDAERPGTLSPRGEWTACGGGAGAAGGAGAPGDSLIATGARGGVLCEADQRVLQVGGAVKG